MIHTIKHSAKEQFDQQIKYETYFSEEQQYIWKNMIKIEKIKKETLLQKNSHLLKNTRTN